MTTLSRLRFGSFRRPLLGALGLSSALIACGPSRTFTSDAGLDGDTADCNLDLPPDLAINFDLRPGRLRGNVTLAGEPLPPSSTDRGDMILSTPGVEYGFFNLGTDAPATLDIPLAAGTYDVFYVPHGNCNYESTDPLCRTHAANRTITIRADEVTVADIDLIPRHLPITLTLGGQPLRESTVGPRGTLWFQRETTYFYRIVPGTGAPTIDVDLDPGTYQLRWTADPTSCGPGLPCADGYMTDAFVVDGSGTPVTLDVSAVPLPARIGGTVTVNGAPMGDASSSRGSLQFMRTGFRPGTGTIATLDVGATGPAQYSTQLPNGTYDLFWLAAPATCVGAQPAPAPCVSYPIRTGVAVTAGGVLDIDLRTVTVTGTVTVNGAAPPDAVGTSRGILGFGRTTTGSGLDITPIPLPATGSATYSLPLAPGSYLVRWTPSGVCTALAGTGMPCNDGLLRAELVVGDAPARYDLDIAAVHARGNLLFNGAAPSAPPGDMAAIAFRQNDFAYSLAFSVSPDTTRTPAYDVLLLAGTYTVGWAPNLQNCTPGLVPTCSSGTVLPSVRLDRDTALDVNVRSTRLHGALTLDGAPLPDATSDRGSIGFGQGQWIQLGTTGPVTFDVSVLATPSGVVYLGGDACPVGTPANVPLCGGAQLLGCGWP